MSFIVSFVDAKQLRNGEVQKFFDSEERSVTTASSSNRTFYSLCFYLLTEWLFGTITEKATESKTTMSIPVTNTTANSKKNQQ